MAFVAKTEATAAATTDLVGTRPTGLQAGDALIAVIGVSNSVTYTPPAGWTLVATGDTGLCLRVFLKVATASEPASWTWVASTSTYHNLVILAYRGIDTTNPLFGAVCDAYATLDPYIRCHNVADTPAGATAIACGVYWYEEGPGAPPSGYTERADYLGSSSTTAQVYACDRELPSGGNTGDQDIVLSANEDYKRGAHIVLRPAAAPGIPRPLLNHLLLGD